ncbi:MAG: DISARM system SNF2-like helicase DrmD [Chloroflexota bacterium]
MGSATPSTELAIPEQGQLVRVRHRFWLVDDILPAQPDAARPAVHRVTLECLDDDRLGERLDVIWEREVGTEVYQEMGLPAPERWDPAGRFQAFLHAIDWSTPSVLTGNAIQAPFHAAIELDDYQLEPVARALVMPRVNLLIADDVGLGKTIEAGLVVQELLARQRIRRILVICPASLQRQWQEEMQSKFQLPFQIIDRQAIQQLRREYGIHVNPWSTYPRLITSMDFIKREQPLRLFRQSLQQSNGNTPLRDWDMLIIDEAHNVAPAGRKAYIRDSDRTRMARALVNHFEHRLFLTATPHNGYTESFTALLELLDPLRFSRGAEVARKQVETVMVRRLKDDIKDELGRRRFSERQVKALVIEETPAREQRLHRLLRDYSASRLERVSWGESLPIRFALTMLKKRLLSSPRAFHLSVETHLRTLDTPASPDPALARRLQERAEEDWDDDEAKARHEDDALEESTRFFTDLTPEERGWLREIQELAAEQKEQPDAKAQLLLEWIAQHLHDNGEWNQERLIVFTEYRDTLNYLCTLLAEQGWEERLMALMGGMNVGQREEIKAAFQASPAQNPVRILLATDAAAEGLNLQNHCRYLIHWEIPWNPNRMEQRNGRIDRHGQRADEVFIYHFAHEDHEDSRFLQTVVDKVRTMRGDLGSVGDVIAEQVEEAMLGRRRELELPERRIDLVKEEARADVLSDQRVRQLRQQRLKAQRELALYPQNLRLVLHEALRLQGHPGLQPIEAGELAGKAYRLTNLPPAWQAAGRSLLDEKNRLLALVFDHAHARERRDVTLIHLNHPLMKRAIAVFRGNLWAAGLSGRDELARAAYRVLPDYKLSAPAMVAFARIVATGELSQRLHEDLIFAGGEIDGQRLQPVEDVLLQDLLAEEGHTPALPQEVGAQLRKLFPAHERQLLELLAQREEAERAQLETLLKEKAQEETKTIGRLMRERIRELEKRLAQREKEAAMYHQLTLPGMDEEERRQFQNDTEWLRRKLTHLRDESAAEPARIKQRYALRNVRVFPLGLLYLLPERLVSG